MDIRTHLAQTLAALRASKGWSQHDLAAACSEIAGKKRSASWVRGYEQKTRWPKPEDLELLGRALGVDPGSLVAAPRELSPQEALQVVARALDARGPDLSRVPPDILATLASAGDGEFGAIRKGIELARIGSAHGAETAKTLLNKGAKRKKSADQ